jgi:hypothetical protein
VPDLAPDTEVVIETPLDFDARIVDPDGSSLPYLSPTGDLVLPPVDLVIGPAADGGAGEDAVSRRPSDPEADA